MAFVTRVENGRELRLRSLDRLDSTVVVSGAGDDAPMEPVFSPDGKWLAFFTVNAFSKVPVGGGTPIVLAEANLPWGADWGADGRIVFAPRRNGGLQILSAAGGEAQSLTEVDPDAPGETHAWPQWLPGGEQVLFTVVSGSEEPSLEVVEVASGDRSVVHPSGFYGRYVPTGHILFADRSALFALPFDPKTQQVEGSPMPVLEGIESAQQWGHAQFDISDNGVLLYMPGSEELQSFDVAWANRSGETEILWDEAGVYGTPRLSPDRRRLALSALKGDDWDVWVYDIERDISTRITFASGYDADGAWSPDGEHIAFASDRNGGISMMRKRADGTGEAEVLIEAGRFEFPAPYSWSPQDKIVFAGSGEGEGGADDLWLLSGDGGEPEPFLSTPFNEGEAAFSPDGLWLAYVSNESGQHEIYVHAVEGSRRYQVSDGHAHQPMWSPSGRELFIRMREGLMSVSVERDGDELRFGRPELLFGEIFASMTGVSVPGYLFYDYDVDADGERFVVFPRRSAADSEEGTTMHAVTNWFEELRNLVESSSAPRLKPLQRLAPLPAE
jgi:serine/threonine-protein kinase